MNNIEVHFIEATKICFNRKKIILCVSVLYGDGLFVCGAAFVWVNVYMCACVHVYALLLLLQESLHVCVCVSVRQTAAASQRTYVTLCAYVWTQEYVKKKNLITPKFEAYLDTFSMNQQIMHSRNLLPLHPWHLFLSNFSSKIIKFIQN